MISSDSLYNLFILEALKIRLKKKMFNKWKKEKKMKKKRNSFIVPCYLLEREEENDVENDNVKSKG